MWKKFKTWFQGKASIRKKLIISFSVLVFIPIVVLGLYSFSKSRQNLEKQIISTVENNLVRLISEMDTRFQREVDYTKYLAYNLDFRRTLEESAKDPVVIAQTLNQSVEPIFWYFITSDRYMKGIKIYTPLIEQDVGAFLKTDEEVREEAWYQYQQSNFHTVWSFRDDNIYAERSILDTGTTSRVIGVLQTEFFEGSLLEPLSSMQYEDNGILLLDAQNQVVFQKTTADAKLDAEVLSHIKEGKKAPDGVILRSGTLDSCGWSVYYYMNEDRISSQVYPILGSTLLVVGLCLIVVFFLINIISRTLSTRVLLLKDKAEEIAQGNFETPYFTEDVDEIGIVTNSIGNMTVRLNEMVNRVYKMELEKQATELKALQAMINPHFLYNSLSSIKWKAIRQGNEEISELTGHLAKFYRTCLNNGKQITTVRNELENIRSYMELQKAAHENNFDYECVLDPEGLEIPMLNFLLQPIVENAIKHGIDYREEEPGRGLVILEFYREDPYLIFQVYNNGPRLTPEKLNQLLNQPGKGYGVSNIRQRIALYYGEDCGLSASVTPQGYTCITIRILQQVTGTE